MIKRSIKDNFFEAFQYGGVVSVCIDFIEDRYDLGYFPKESIEERNNRLNDYPPEKREEFIQIQEYWDNFYENVALKQIERGFREFDYTVIGDYDYFNDTEIVNSSLMEEIEEDLKGCSKQEERTNYIFSLLKFFKQFSDVFYPLEVINEMNVKLKNMEDKGISDSTIDKYKEQIERVSYISQRFHELGGISSSKQGEYSIDQYLWDAVNIERLFANRLDALLLKYKIDLMELQSECGIYLKSHRRVEDVEPYIGSMKLAQKYIDELNTHKENKQIEEKLIEGRDEMVGDYNSYRHTPFKNSPVMPDIEKVSNPVPDNIISFEPLRDYIKYKDADNIIKVVLPQLNKLTLVNSKEKAALAAILYRYGWWNIRLPKTFKDFERVFFALFGWDVPTYKPCRLNEAVESLKIKHPFLGNFT